MAQTDIIIKLLSDAHPGLDFQVIPIKTSGDRITSAAELRNAGKGLFVKEIERALLRRTITLAVHSAKDLPSEMTEGLALGAVPERADPSDAFIGQKIASIEKLPPNAQVGTSSLRRQAILRSLYPHLDFVEMKGNLDTRLAKLRNSRSSLAGIVVAAAGVRRLHPDNGIPVQILPRDIVVPAAGQGALAVQIREGDEKIREILSPIHHAPTAACIEAERDLLRRLEGGCQVPLGALAEASDDGLLRLIACLASLDGSRVIRESQTGTVEDPRSIAEALETILNSRGAQEILAGLRPRATKARRRSLKPHRNGRPRKRTPAKARSRR